MIGYIKGTVLSKENGVALIENNGMGYEITCSSASYDGLKEGGTAELFTYMAVREDGVYLYGFTSKEEKQMFLKLITVSGVGPKMGISVLSGMSLKDLAVKIATSDIKGLSAIKGLGKKTAERIIVELREKVQADGVEEDKAKEVKQEKYNEDAVIALMSLGLNKSEAVKAVLSAQQSGAVSVSEIVTSALKNMR